MATKLARKDDPALWSTYPSAGTATAPLSARRDACERQRRIAHLRELVSSGTYKVNLERLAGALIRRGGLARAVYPRALN